MSDDRRAKDLLSTLPVREPVGARLVARVGSRAWERPAVAVSGKIFAHYKLGDPWAPTEVERSLALGPVSARFGEKRQPAPHALPKAPVAAAATPAPPAKQAAPPPPKPAPPKPAPPKPPLPKAAPAKPEPKKPEPKKPEPARMFDKPERPALKGKLPVRPDLGKPAEPPPAASAEPASSKQQRGGRLGLRPTDTSGPAVRKSAAPERAPEAAPPPAPAPVPRPILAESLDDLFGAAAEMGRMSLGKRKPPKEEK